MQICRGAELTLSAYANIVLYFLSRESEQLISHWKVHETLQIDKQHTDKKSTFFSCIVRMTKTMCLIDGTK